MATERLKCWLKAFIAVYSGEWVGTMGLCFFFFFFYFLGHSKNFCNNAFIIHHCSNHDWITSSNLRCFEISCLMRRHVKWGKRKWRRIYPDNLKNRSFRFISILTSWNLAKLVVFFWQDRVQNVLLVSNVYIALTEVISHYTCRTCSLCTYLQCWFLRITN